MDDACFIAFGKEIVVDHFKTFFQISEIHFFRFPDEGIYHVSLPAFFQFFFDKPEYVRPFFLKGMKGGDRLSARRQLVDHRYVQVAVKRHGECAGDRGGGHHEYVGRDDVFVP